MIDNIFGGLFNFFNSMTVSAGAGDATGYSQPDVSPLFTNDPMGGMDWFGAANRSAYPRFPWDPSVNGDYWADKAIADDNYRASLIKTSGAGVDPTSLSTLPGLKPTDIEPMAPGDTQYTHPSGLSPYDVEPMAPADVPFTNPLGAVSRTLYPNMGKLPVNPRISASQRQALADVDPRVVNRLAALQGVVGRDLKVISGYRSPTHNSNVGGASRSQHLDGNAIDVDVSDMSTADRKALISLASELGFTGIGVYNNSMHFDIGSRRAWGPSYGSDSIPGWARGAISAHLSGPEKVAAGTRPPLTGKFAGVSRLGGPQQRSLQHMTNNQKAIPGEATAYSPVTGGDTMEGGLKAARKGPDGTWLVRTLADFEAGESDYVTLAGSPKLRGNKYIIPEIPFRKPNGETVILKNVPAVVHDTGAAFRKAPEGRFDIPIGIDLDDRTMAINSDLWKKAKIKFVKDSN